MLDLRQRAVLGEEPATPVSAVRLIGVALLLAAILGVLEMFGAIGDGYFAGWGDHFVLSPEGLSWAHPGAFLNDWFMEAAPQPHWFFDAMTYAGESLGVLSLFYAVFWALGLVAFGAATALLAYRFVPAAPIAAALGVTLITAVTPWMIGGTGSPVIAQALPAVLSAQLIYLLIAGLLTERRLLVVLLAPAIAIVHVQQGSIAIVLLVAMLVVEGVRLRKLDWALVLALVLTGAFVVFGLTIRPIASNLQDFVAICDQIIVYHCAAHMWSNAEHYSTIGLIVLTCLSAFVVPRSSRWIWFTTVGLATLGYAGGYAADALRIPLLDTLAQGVNVYRLGALLLPFAMWGAVAPLLVRLRGWLAVLLIAVCGAAWFGFLMAPGWPTPSRRWLVLMVAALVVPAFVLLLWTRRSRGSDLATRSRATRVSALSAGLLVVMVTAVLGGLTVRVPNFAFIQDANLRAWGEQVRDAVPEGSVLVASPRSEWVKLVTQRAVIADCKDIPYGGPAWQEWHRRIAVLGGYEQCVAPGPLLYDQLPARALVDVADQFRSDFIVVNPAAEPTAEALEELGWTRVVTIVGGSGGELLQRPN